MRSLLPLFVLAACSSSETPLTNATSLECPTPGALPFRLTSSGFQKAVNQTLVKDDPRNKDQASDTLGSTTVSASVYLADDQAPGPAGVAYHGVKARTAPGAGLQSTPLAGEVVSLWQYDPGPMKWFMLGGGVTDGNGQYDIAGPGITVNGQARYAMLEADGSCAAHYDFLLKAGSKVVVTDIDGTLTASDGELLSQLTDITYVPKIMGAADKMLQAWAQKGYPIIYLTARTHVLRMESRLWLDDIGAPTGPLITANGGKNDDVYKTLWMNRMIHDFGWNVVAAYGNADTDITAYKNAGVPDTLIFTVGPLAGSRGTIAIAGNDFTQHINTFVSAQPANQ